ncbi:MAG: putative LPS assembly protein LptD [Niabella sp.]
MAAIIIMATHGSIASLTKYKYEALADVRDTVPLRKPGAAAGDTVLPRKDSSFLSSLDSLGMDSKRLPDTSLLPKSDTFSLKLSKDSLDAPVTYEAEDSVVGLMDTKIITLYNKAKVDYQDISLSAPIIALNQDSKVVKASGAKDTSGAFKQAEMKMGDQTMVNDSMSYNFQTKKGLSNNVITQQGEMFIHTQIAKRMDENVMYGKGTYFTTCNLDEPHFGFRARRSKIVNKKLAVTGLVWPEFDSVPMPIALPFGFFPLSQGRKSGLLAPSFETNDVQGVGLSGLGYYYVISDYFDVQLTGNIYSLGSWSANVLPKYMKRYKYNGAVNFGLQHTQRGFKGDPDFYSSNTYTFNWNHSQDTRSRPGTSFSANVNMSSTKYNEEVPNNNTLNYQNTMGSSITYAKTWQDKPFNLSVSANHSQANVSRTMTVSFPNVSFNMNTIYPLEKKKSVGAKKWYEQLGIGYQGSFRNSVTFYDTVKAKQVYGKSMLEHLLDTTQWGAQHSIPITLALPPVLGGAVVISPSVSYAQEWVDRVTSRHWEKGVKRWDGTYTDSLMASIDKQMTIKQNASFGVGVSTALYGTFGKSSGTQVRHVARPNVSFSYSPDLNKKFWQAAQVDSAGTIRMFNKLDGFYGNGSLGVTSKNFGGISFGIDNNLEMKKLNRAKRDTSDSDSDSVDDKDKYKKVKLIEGFGFSSSYNLAADSFKLSDFNLYIRTKLFDKIDINASGIFTPYQLNQYGNKMRNFAYEKGKLGSLTSGTISASASFQSKPKDEAKEKARKEQINQALNDPALQAQQMELLEYMRSNPSEFVDFNTPWTLNVSYSLNFSRGYNSSLGRSAFNISSGAMLSGSFNLTPKWNVSGNTAFDFKTKEIQTLAFSLSRDLHCWQMAINVTPIGRYRMFSFTINPKSSLLQDLKINRTRSFFSN